MARSNDNCLHTVLSKILTKLNGTLAVTGGALGPYTGPTAAAIGAAVGAEVLDPPSAADIAAANLASLGANPTALDIANAMIDRQRARLTGAVIKGLGTAVVSLPVAAGQRGNLKGITTNVGTSRFTLNATPPVAAAGAARGENAINGAAVGVDNIDLSLVRVAGATGASAFTVYYEIYS
jgi:hypothetical protein